MNTLHLVIKILAGILLIPSVFFLIKHITGYNKRYKAMVDFLRLQNDRETLSKIGYVEFYGEEYGMRRSYSKTNALLQLYTKYEETKLHEYFDYAKYLEKQPYPVLGLSIAVFILIIVFSSL